MQLGEIASINTFLLDLVVVKRLTPAVSVFFLEHNMSSLAGIILFCDGCMALSSSLFSSVIFISILF